MIILVTGWFDVFKDGYPTGKKEFVASHGFDTETGRDVIIQCVHPADLGAVFDESMKEWILS